MKVQLPVFVLMCSTITSSAQVFIRGMVRDKQQNFLNATVSLITKDSALVKTVATGKTGEFIFENVVPGNYIISSSSVGYSKFSSQGITVEKENIILPDIILDEQATELSGVAVKSKKPLFQQEIDRLVMNVQSSITSSGNSVLDLLQKSPGVVVNRQNNTISMNGKTGVRIMINGKLQEMPLDVVMQMLDGMSSSNVEKIELITTPPSKYDADGTAGIIHIVMKGNKDPGTNGSFGLTVGCRWSETLGGNFNLNHRSKRFGFLIDYSVLRNHNLHILKMSRQSPENGFEQTVNDNSHRENITTQQNLNAGIEWKLSDNILLSLAFTGYRSNWDMHALTQDNNHIAIDSTVFTKMNIHESNIWQSATGGIGLQTKMNSNSALSVNLDYLYYHNSNPSDYDDQVLFEQGNLTNASTIDLKKTTPIRFLIATADYQTSFSPSFSLETGIKAVASNLDNDVLVRRLENNVWTTDSVFTSYSTLHEQVGAAYVSVKWQIRSEWQLNSGLRYEYTHTSIGSATQKHLIDRKYRYVFPGLSLKKEFDKKRDLQFAYSRRITRPTYNDIAPFVFFWGPNTFSAGNTALLPAISDAVKAGYHVRRWIISLQFSHSKNEISFLQPEKDNGSDNLIYRSQNLKYLNTLALINSWSFNVASWWEVQANVTGQFQVAKNLHLANNVTLHNYGININVTNSVKLPDDFSLEVSGMYQSKTLTGISQYLPAGSLNAGIQKKWGRGTLKFSADDIFNTNNWRIKTNVPENNLHTYFNYDFHTRFVRITYTRSFGNNKLQSLKLKSGSEEERARVKN